MFQTIINWFYNTCKTIVTQHSDKLITVFFAYNYYVSIMHDFCERNNIRLRKSTKLIVPEIPTYFAKFFYYTIPNLNNSKFASESKYYLYYETNSDINIPINHADHKTVYMYTTPEHILCYVNDRPAPVNDVVRSKAKFINIVYSNPAFEKPLTLRLDHKYMMSDNEILSASHVLYLLRTEYETNEYVFDINYKLKIMDNNLNVIILKSNQWLQLTAAPKGPGYTIMSDNNTDSINNNTDSNTQ